MRYLSIDKLKSGMLSASTIQDVYGRILVERNRILSDSYIAHLKEMGFPGIYIEDEISRGIEVEPSISQQVKQNAMESVKAADPDLCSEVAVDITEELIRKKRVSMDLMDIRSNSDFTYAHSVNVAVISGIIALGMHLGREAMKKATLAGLLHDLGKMQIPDEILNKPERLNSEEYRIMKTHARLSYEYIMDRKEVPDDVKEAVLHHHENVDGTGYPDGTTIEEQNILTRIIHVADVYDALTSKRPYKEPFAPYEALEYLMGGCGTYFDRNVVEALSLYVPLYPKGTEVKLSDGNEGVIFDNSGIHNIRPIIRILSGRLMDLSAKDNIGVAIVEDNVDHTASILENEKKRKKMAERKTIYVVDNDEEKLKQFYDELKENYEVHGFSNGKDVVHKVKRIRKLPKLVLINTDLPDLSGIDAAEQVKLISNYEIPVIFVSEHADPNTIMSVKKAGADGYVLRPYQQKYLLSEIERVLKSMVR